MYRTKIILSDAILMEETGEITILDPTSDTSYHPKASVWINNYKSIRTKYAHIDSSKLLSFIKAKYLIEVPLDETEDSISWKYIYGFENKEFNKGILQENIEYVYVLINPGYPDLVKIGMTTKLVETRVRSINKTGTVYEWVPKFALPVQKGTALKVEQSIHKAFEHLRIDSDQGNEREFFRLDPLTAFDKVREIGSFYQVGNHIVY